MINCSLQRQLREWFNVKFIEEGSLGLLKHEYCSRCSLIDVHAHRMCSSPGGWKSRFEWRDRLCHIAKFVFEVVIIVNIWEIAFTVIFSLADNSSNLDPACPWDNFFLLHPCTLSCYITWHSEVIINNSSYHSVWYMAVVSLLSP